MTKLVSKNSEAAEKDRLRIISIKAGKKHVAMVAAMSPEARAKVREDERRQIEDFMNGQGVSVQPPSWAPGSQYSIMFGTDL